MSAHDHASALASMRDSGAAVAFTKEVAGEHDPVTETFTEPTKAVVSGYGIEVKSETKDFQNIEFEAGELVTRQPTTLLFVASNYGEMPELSSWVMWAGVRREVYVVRPLRPDGVAIMSRVVIA